MSRTVAVCVCVLVQRVSATGLSDGVALGCVCRTVVSLHGSDYIRFTTLTIAGPYPGLAHTALRILMTCQIRFHLYACVFVQQQ